MPVTEFFPYLGPNRRSDKTVVEVTLDFSADEKRDAPLKETRLSLVEGGVMDISEAFPARALPDHWMVAYSSLLAQTALLLQRSADHRVAYFSVSFQPERNRCVVLVEHEHCDVGMTAVKLASELVSGRRRMLKEPFAMFRKFAGERLLPNQTEAIISAALQRDIPVTHLERLPYSRNDFAALTQGKCICPNGLIMLGHGAHQRVLDGTWSLDLGEDLAGDGGDPVKVAEQVLDRLFPGGKPARVPIIAITGTNGKTTTTRMVNHVMHQAGRKPGMVCTDGIYIGGQEVVSEDKSTRGGHLQVLTNRQVDIAVLETHHAGIIGHGFAFHWCDIAVCLNVTDDHLGEANIDTVEQMAAVKQALPERARSAAVLNADDAHCLAMIKSIRADRLCLVSMTSTAPELQGLAGGRAACFCVLERVGGQEWLVIHDGGEIHRVMTVAQIPATFDGSARFNVSNAMHAAVASYLAGVDPGVIRAAMSSFASSYKTTPGRLNVFDELPFRIVMDFAHNPHGMRELCEFTDRQLVEGRKIIVFSGSSNRLDESIRDMGRAVAGHFDVYVCKEHIHRTQKNPRTVAHLLKEGLLHAGVAQEKITITGSGEDVIFEVFDICEPGDLLVMLMGHVEKNLLPGWIEEYVSRDG